MYHFCYLASSLASVVGTKKRWTAEDKTVVLTLFESYINRRKLPSLDLIQKSCSKYPSLDARDPAVIKTWISNQFKNR